jgi:hypothetical protein
MFSVIFKVQLTLIQKKKKRKEIQYASGRHKEKEKI